MIVVNRQHVIVLANKAAGEFLNRSVEQLIGATYFDLVSREEAEAGTLVDEQIFLTGESDEREECVVDGYGVQRHLVTRKHLVDGGDGTPLLVGIVHDVTAYRQAEARNLHLSLHDVLTGLPNRALLRDRLEQAAARLPRHSGHCALLYIDLDHFKEINDTYGHQAGDDVILEFSARATAQLRSSDTMARLGGDEFAVLLTDLGSLDEGLAIAGRILDVSKRPFEFVGGRASISCSIGLVLLAEPTSDCDELHRRADVALYKAKNAGRGRVEVFSEEMDAVLKRRRLIELELIEALRTFRGLEVYYQPLVANQGHDVLGMEALLRWHHPELGEIPTVEAISVAEDSGLIVPLGDWVLVTACRTLVPWENIAIAVNVSPVQLRDPNFVDRVTAVLQLTGIEPHRLQLELTETAVIEAGDSAVISLKRLRSLGVKIALDDFGTGYSSLSHLHRYEVDKVKIDQSFVERVGQSANSTAIVRAITRMGQSLGLEITAEGVETDEQRQFLLESGCTELQGFLFSEPLSADEMAAFLQENRSRRGPVRTRNISRSGGFA